MYLTPQQQRTLDGEDGEARRISMEILNALGIWAEAERLIPVTSSQVAGVSYRTGDVGLVTFLRHMCAGGAKVTIPTYLNPSGMDNTDWEAMGIDPGFAAIQKDIIRMYSRMGIFLTCTCAGYDIGNIGGKGEHVAWSESSMVAFGNSYLGVRTNREGGPSALASAIIGMTPEYGLHLTKNRVPTVRVDVEADMKDAMDFGLLGRWYSAKYSNGQIPVFHGLDTALGKADLPPYIHIKQLCAALGTGKTPMFHAHGVTPEQELIPETTAIEDVFDNDARDKTWDEFRPPSAHVDIVVLGCPHTSLPELQRISDLLRGKKVDADSLLWVFTGRHNSSILETSGIKADIEASGARVFYDTCPVVSPIQGRFGRIATNSAKAARYMVTMARAEVVLRPVKECIELVTQEEVI